MPFNKGDFTQQGVAGHVNANIRLNEKRLVNIDLTSNEDDEGCTIAGNVTDLLNNEVYPIGAGVSGNIEITENGENINVAPYATATVNVSGGGSEVKTFSLTAYNNASGEASVGCLFIDSEGILNEGFAVNGLTTVTKDILISYDSDVLEYFVVPEMGYGTEYVSYSDAVNCTVFDEDGIYIVITDIDSPASVAITVHKDVI